MLKGDLSTTPLAPLLLDLAADSATGCLHITDTDDEEALVYLKNGLIYSVVVPGNRPQLGAKLVSSGALAPEALAEALEAQRNELQGWRLGELLVHLGYVEQPVVEAFVKEQVSEALWDLLRWGAGHWKFRKNVKAREDVGPPMVVVELLESLRERGYEWESISAVVHGPGAVPKLSARGDASPETTLDNDAWSMLCKIDGERSVAELASDCGYTLFEAGHVIVSLVQAGLVDIEEEIDFEGDALYGATTLTSAFAGMLETDGVPQPEPASGDGEDALARLARLVSEVAAGGEPETPPNEPADDVPTQPANVEPDAGEDLMTSAHSVAPAQRTLEPDLESAMVVPLHRRSNESFAAAIARVSGALSEVLGEAPLDDGAPPAGRPVRPRNAPLTDDPEWQRRKRLRSAAAAELATAQALIETLRSNQDVASGFDGEVPKVVSRETERRRAAARDAEQEARHAAEEAALVAAEQFAKAAAEEAQRHAAAQQEATRLAEEAAAAEQAAAEFAAAEQERLHAERVAAEEVAWAEYWRREEADRLEAERIAAEEAARLEAERLAAEEAERLEAERLEAERVEAERVEAERIAAEEAARLEAERLEAERIEAERLEAEEAARLEAERVEAERMEAEEAARLEAERVEAERVEAERVEAERLEAERLAAEEAARLEAERRAAEEAEAAEAARRAAEQAAAERAAEEAERLAAEAEAAHLAAEEAESHAAEEKVREAAAARAERVARRKAEKLAAEEATRREEAAAAATALLVELSSLDRSEPDAPEGERAPDAETAAADDADREPVSVGVGAGADGGDSGYADTAALLRELSSLGGDDEPEPAPMQMARPMRKAPPEKKPKKKIGLFGL